MFEVVYMVWDFYDGLRSGIADFGGRSHVFKATQDSDGGYTDVFELVAIRPAFAATVEQQWSISQRGRARGFKLGRRR